MFALSLGNFHAIIAARYFRHFPCHIGSYRLILRRRPFGFRCYIASCTHITPPHYMGFDIAGVPASFGNLGSLAWLGKLDKLGSLQTMGK
jgi:hypothetical protein